MSGSQGSSVIDNAGTKTSRLNLLIGNNEELLSELMRDLVKAAAPAGADVKERSTFYVSELFEIAGHTPIDVFVLVLNNMYYEAHTSGGIDLAARGLQLIRELRGKFSVPIIAIYGHPADPSYAQRAMDAGADFATLMPFDLPSMQATIAELLSHRK